MIIGTGDRYENISSSVNKTIQVVKFINDKYIYLSADIAEVVSEMQAAEASETISFLKIWRSMVAILHKA